MKSLRFRGFTHVRTSESKGFTLIELLVVIAIIGLLASIILASLNTAQQKGRDARRVSDLQEIGQAMVANDSGSGTTLGSSSLGTCASGSNISDCTVGSATFSSYADPSSGTACASKSVGGPCNYTLEDSAGTLTSQNYEVCAYLEAGSGSLIKGMVYVAASSSGSVLQGCP